MENKNEDQNENQIRFHCWGDRVRLLRLDERTIMKLTNLIRTILLIVALLFIGGFGFDQCEPCNDPSQLICPDEW